MDEELSKIRDDQLGPEDWAEKLPIDGWRAGSLVTGAKVQAGFEGSADEKPGQKARRYPGKITQDNGDGTFCVTFDNGKKDAAVPESIIVPARVHERPADDSPRDALGRFKCRIAVGVSKIALADKTEGSAKATMEDEAPTGDADVASAMESLNLELAKSAAWYEQCLMRAEADAKAVASNQLDRLRLQGDERQHAASAAPSGGAVAVHSSAELQLLQQMREQVGRCKKRATRSPLTHSPPTRHHSPPATPATH
jgi:hypothetical protein